MGRKLFQEDLYKRQQQIQYQNNFWTYVIYKILIYDEIYETCK